MALTSWLTQHLLPPINKLTEKNKGVFLTKFQEVNFFDPVINKEEGECEIEEEALLSISGRKSNKNIIIGEDIYFSEKKVDVRRDWTFPSTEEEVKKIKSTLPKGCGGFLMPKSTKAFIYCNSNMKIDKIKNLEKSIVDMFKKMPKKVI